VVVHHKALNLVTNIELAEKPYKGPML
jgi:hypothetical protein